mgnify:CR=1 FL=1
MSIKETLQSMGEVDLKSKVIVPLMRALGCPYVKDHHGPDENGKDVIYEFVNIYRDKSYGAIIIKNSGNLGKSQIENVERQAREAVKEFLAPKTTTQTIVHELTIMTSFDVTENLRDYMYKESGIKDFHNLHIVDGDRLQGLIISQITEYNKLNSTQQPYLFDPETFLGMCESKIQSPIQNTDSGASVLTEV